ncbi:MAG: hypothetical protein LBS54_05140 [Dysgonamonadaceae bacterium]|jgi:hypothetical protein|nr:hypothetical protein [Dysgonamonadaceae bacterium]
MKRLFLAVAVFLAAFTLKAQESKGLELSAGADIVSKYVWRGANQGQGAAFQPTLGLSWKGLSLSAWGSTGFAGQEAYEFDISLGYSVAGLSVALTDYYWDGQAGEYDDHENCHHLEASASYSFSIPLTLSAATMIGFNDPGLNPADPTLGTTDPTERNLSTYLSAGYDFAIGAASLTASIGVTPWGSALWGSGEDKFEVADISLKGSKELKITDRFSVPVFVQGILAPATKSAHLVFGLSF